MYISQIAISWLWYSIIRDVKKLYSGDVSCLVSPDYEIKENGMLWPDFLNKWLIDCVIQPLWVI